MMYNYYNVFSLSQDEFLGCIRLENIDSLASTPYELAIEITRKVLDRKDDMIAIITTRDSYVKSSIN